MRSHVEAYAEVANDFGVLEGKQWKISTLTVNICNFSIKIVENHA